jgi:hypothetical protein
VPSRLFVLAVPLKIRDGLALVIDVTLPALNSAFSFLDVSLQDGLLHRTSYRSSMESGPLSSGSNQRQKRVSPNQA